MVTKKLGLKFIIVPFYGKFLPFFRCTARVPLFSKISPDGLKIILDCLKLLPKPPHLFTETTTQKCSRYFFFELFYYGKGNIIKVGVGTFTERGGVEFKDTIKTYIY